MRSAKANLDRYVYKLAHTKSLNKTTLQNVNKIVNLMRIVKNQAARKIQKKWRNTRKRN